VSTLRRMQSVWRLLERYNRIILRDESLPNRVYWLSLTAAIVVSTAENVGMVAYFYYNPPYAGWSGMLLLALLLVPMATILIFIDTLAKVVTASALASPSCGVIICYVLSALHQTGLQHLAVMLLVGVAGTIALTAVWSLRARHTMILAIRIATVVQVVVTAAALMALR